MGRQPNPDFQRHSIYDTKYTLKRVTVCVNKQ